LGLDGSLVPIDEDPRSLDRLYDATTWTHDPSGLVFTSAVGDEAVYELATADGETLAAAGDEWPRSGVVVTRVSEALPGVFAIETAARGLYLVDAAAGVLVVHSPEFAPGENTRLPATAVFFEQATSPGRGQFFGD
jgi:hypothetical protein